ncbi:MAG TPA: glycosyltransferase [Candidatus Eisenbacteria bacterium]|nr:glycosyltransferase [Candidatus Eisenbacteria bacterium]
MAVASVVICTHNRADLVAHAVGAALPQVRACGGEVIVVDNASTDATPTVLRDVSRTYGDAVRIVEEPRLGLSVARNRGLHAARGDVVAYLDDDAVPRPGWLAALVAPYDDPKVVAVGGRIVLRFAGAPPPWLSTEIYAALSAYDLGPIAGPVRYGHATYPFGANISFRVAAARAAGGFSSTVGPLGRHQLVHDETDLCYRLEHAGGVVWYTPDAVVDHHVVPERLSPRWMLRRHWAGGQSAAVFILRNRGVLRAVWRLWWLYWGALTALPYDTREPIDPGRFAHECRRREALGYVTGLVRALPRLAELRRDLAA